MDAFERSIRSREMHLLLGICLLALLIRVAFSFVLFPRLADPLNLGRDPDLFGWLATNWATGKGYAWYEGAGPTTFRGPGYPLLLAAVYRVFGDLLPGAVLAQCLMGALLCLVIYYTGELVFGAWVGYTAAFLGALHPLLIWYSPRLRYEPLLALLLALAVYWMLKAQDSRALKDAFLMGLFLGCAALVNQVVILLPLVVLAGFLLLPKTHKATLAKQLAVALVTMVAIITPWTVRNYQASGRIIPVHSGAVMDFIKGNYELEHYDEAPLQLVKLEQIADEHVARLLGLDPSEYDLRAEGVDQALLPHALSFVRNEPGKLLAKIAVMVPRFWYLSESPLKSWVLASVQGPFLLLASVGALHALRTSRRVLLLVLITVYFNLVYAVFHGQARFSTLVVPYVIILAAAALPRIFDAIKRWRLRQAVKVMRSATCGMCRSTYIIGGNGIESRFTDSGNGLNGSSVEGEASD
jgi:4-amino-4-deoxy-L-arabinose transferase-like glycosyltransferase